MVPHFTEQTQTLGFSSNSSLLLKLAAHSIHAAWGLLGSRQDTVYTFPSGFLLSQELLGNAIAILAFPAATALRVLTCPLILGISIRMAGPKKD